MVMEVEEGGIAPYSPRTVEEVFTDFKGRRAGLIKALTTDVERFYQQCDPEKENLCLYGFPNEEWEVNLPAEEVPPELPEPALGINFARDGMQERDWLSLVAVHSDAWLLSVAFYFGARFGFDKTERLWRALKRDSQRRSHQFQITASIGLSQALKGEALNRSNMQKQCQRMRTGVWMGKVMMMSTARLSVVHVGRAMLLMNSGFAATYVRSGSMENA
ncbi:unnamed protein product [Malus baccata var. baccata]